jgi:hypothetical protein
MTVVDFIWAGYASGSYVTCGDALNFGEREFRQCLTHLRIQSFLARNDDVVDATIVSPQEKLRLEVPRQFLDDYVKLIKDYIPLTASELIFNIDECSFSDWEKLKDKPIITPLRFAIIALFNFIARNVGAVRRTPGDCRIREYPTRLREDIISCVPKLSRLPGIRAIRRTDLVFKNRLIIEHRLENCLASLEALPKVWF